MHPLEIVTLSIIFAFGFFVLLLESLILQVYVCLIGLDILQGYYVFSQKLKHIVRLPFATTAYGTYLSLVFLQPHNLVLFEFFCLSPVILVQLTM